MLGLLEGRGGERSRLRSCQLRFDEQRARLARLAEAASRGRVEDGSTAALQLHGHVVKRCHPDGSANTAQIQYSPLYSNTPEKRAVLGNTATEPCPAPSVKQYSNTAQYIAIHRNTAIQQYSTIQYTAQYNPPQSNMSNKQ